MNASRFEEALGKHSRALEAEPANESLYLSLGLTNQSVGRFADAARAIRRSIELAPKDAQAHYSLALLYEAMASEAGRRADADERRRRLAAARRAWEAMLALEREGDRLPRPTTRPPISCGSSETTGAERAQLR